MTSWHGIIFREISGFWKNLRQFVYDNYSVFELTFLGLYTIEQLTLVWFTFNSDNIQELAFIISIFAIIILTTFAMHKVVIESRARGVKEAAESLYHETYAYKTRMEYEMKHTLEKYKQAIGYIEELSTRKSLNKPKEFLIKTRDIK